MKKDVENRSRLFLPNCAFLHFEDVHFVDDLVLQTSSSKPSLQLVTYIVAYDDQ